MCISTNRLYVPCDQYEVLEESKRMVPDCERRLETIRDELQATLVGESTVSEESVSQFNA